MAAPLSDAQLHAIRQLDTCAVSNAIEQFGVRLRNEGYTKPGIRCLFPDLPPMLGYAVTSRIRCSNPSPSGQHYVDRTDWWKSMAALPAPHVAVIQDLDRDAIAGASVGETHASILRALHCVGIVTDGAVRDLPAIGAMGFPMFARRVCVSHAYRHLVDFGTPVEILGLRIKTGDLLYGDCHGVISIPLEIAGEVAAKSAELRKKERHVIDLCHSPEFSLEKLQDAVRDIP